MYTSQVAQYPPQGNMALVTPATSTAGPPMAPPIQRLYPDEMAAPALPSLPEGRYGSATHQPFIQNIPKLPVPARTASPQVQSQEALVQDKTHASSLQGMFGKKISFSSVSDHSESKPIVSSTAKMLPAPFPKVPRDIPVVQDAQKATQVPTSTTSQPPKKLVRPPSPRSHAFSKQTAPDEPKQVPTSSEEKVDDSDVKAPPEEHKAPPSSTASTVPASSVDDFPASISVPHGVPIKLGIKQELQARKELEQAMASPPIPVKDNRPFKVKSRWLRFSELETPAPAPQSDANLPTSTSSEGPSQNQKTLEQTSSDIPPSAAETTPSKQEVKKEDGSYDAWDPSSDIIISPSPKSEKPNRRESKKKDREKEKEKDNLPSISGTVESEVKEVKVEKVEEVDENKPPYFDRIEENIYLGER